MLKGGNSADNERVREESNVSKNDSKSKHRRKSKQDDRFSDERNFAEYTSLHGVIRAANVRPWYGKAFWTLACIAAWTALVVQLADLISTYMSHKTTTSMEIVQPLSGLEFPAVTVCGFNRINRTALEKDLHIPFNDTELLDYLLNSFTNYNLNLRNYTAKTVKRIHQKYTKYSGKSWNFSEFLDIASRKNEKSFIDGCLYFPNNDVMRLDCSGALLHSYTTSGSCFTFNNLGSHFKADNVKRAGAFSGLMMEIKLNSDENTVTINSDYPDTVDGVKFLVHPRYMPPQHIEDNGDLIRPGSYVSIGMTIQKYFREMRPWGLCESSDDLKEDSPDYSPEACDLKCKVLLIRKSCNCHPFTMSHEHGGMRACEMWDVINCTTIVSMLYDYSPSDTKALLCGRPVCKNACRTNDYSLSVSSADYPTSGFRELLEKQTRVSSKGVSRIVIDIHFSRLTVKEYREHRATTVVELLSDFGGQLGLCLGASVLTLAEIGEYLIFKIRVLIFWLRKNRNADKKQKDESMKNEPGENVL